MDEMFEKKFEELFGDLEEKVEDIFHSCLVYRFGEDALDNYENYGQLLSMRIEDIIIEFKDTLGTELFYMDDEIVAELEPDEDWDVPLEARGEPWNLDKEEDKEEKDLDDI